MRLYLVGAILTAATTATACAGDGDRAGLAPDLAADKAGESGVAGAVYTASNAAAGNAILAFPRSADGSLGAPQSFATGGAGTGAGLGNQGGVVLSRNGRLLFAVNAGSNDISVFRVAPNGLSLLDRAPSGGQLPISVTAGRRLVYVLNAGGTGNVSGFRLRDDGTLSPLPGSTRPLSSNAADPAQIELGADEGLLVVTEKATNVISTYTVDREGFATGPTPQASVGQTPFGFAFSKGTLVVSEAFGGAADASAMSSYRFGAGHGLQVISASVPTTETAACWVAITPNGRFAYTTNTGSGSISGYRLEPNGRLTLLDPGGVTATTGGGPIDLAFTGNGQYLYSLNGSGSTISGFRVHSDGSLAPNGTTTGLPAGANGLAAH